DDASIATISNSDAGSERESSPTRECFPDCNSRLLPACHEPKRSGLESARIRDMTFPAISESDRVLAVRRTTPARSLLSHLEPRALVRQRRLPDKAEGA